jgi:hypothetical protein
MKVLILTVCAFVDGLSILHPEFKRNNKTKNKNNGFQ